MDKLSYDGPIVLAILDGVGLAPDGPGNAVSKARTPFLGRATKDYLHVALNASGEAVGLLSDQMGNSEVGHNTMGAGRAIKQGIAHIEEAFNSGAVFESDAWKGAITRILSENEARIDNSDKVWYNEEMEPATLHFAGIFSDGGVHSHISHLGKMIKKAYEEGVRRIRVHAIFDGRDVAPESEPKYIRFFEEFASRYPDVDIKIASGGGRQTTVADRYENDWSVVERGFKMMVWGEAEYYFHSAEEGVLELRKMNPGVQDQDLPAFVVVDEDDKPVGKVNKGDSLIYLDFRADRAIEIAQAFTYWDFPYFNRGDYEPTDVYFVGMTEYNSDTHVPEHRLVEPVHIGETLTKFLGSKGISQLAVSETVKFGHVTYYFNGNSYEKVSGEEHVEISSYTEPFETRPWMKSAEITDAVIDSMEKYKFIRINYPGGDMVGHTGILSAAIKAVEAVDECVGKLYEYVMANDIQLIICADHGNSDKMIDYETGKPFTAHTTNPVPLLFINCGMKQVKGGGALCDIAPSLLELLNLPKPDEMTGRSLLEL